MSRAARHHRGPIRATSSVIWVLVVLVCAGSMGAQPVTGNAAPPIRMVALGNSYISGQGADDYRSVPADTSSYRSGTTGPNNYCFRSRHAAVEIVADRLGAQLTNATCAAAEPRHVDQIAQFDEGRQIDHLERAADIVVMQVIGNPEFLNVVACVQLSECDARTVERSMAVLDGEQRRHEQRIHREVRARAPQARIYILSAPQVVPRPGQEYHARCGWFMSDREVVLLNAFVDKIDEISRTNAQLFGATFVDLDGADSPWRAQRHDLCSAQPWVWGPRLHAPQYEPDSLSLRNWSLGSYHPTRAGQSATATVLFDAIGLREPTGS
ncbi:GDSL-type esterase/lipase family protein [Gordonia sp. Z-3]|uniref:GDSL-type esterase/lipase family protein n=1 Tax=unclassified Gordonia (in: high G+C Gram-positive bacteria) TaxID=2657482 RepID=UPI00257B8DE5|nr:MULTISPECIES: GDSL-type esterase/lipase family protein [unclassified Gordonia (in: high G+C Gram-positive bacteria)]MED5801480.1 GDSL-type esterase/lipase family protein [Gordonia sp. Z-3]